MTIKSVSNLVLYALLLPLFSTMLLKTFKMEPLAKDMFITRWSGVLTVIGALLIAFSSTPTLLIICESIN